MATTYCKILLSNIHTIYYFTTNSLYDTTTVVAMKKKNLFEAISHAIFLFVSYFTAKSSSTVKILFKKKVLILNVGSLLNPLLNYTRVQYIYTYTKNINI